MGVPDVYKVSRIAEGKTSSAPSPQGCWPRSETQNRTRCSGEPGREIEQASLLLKAAQQPTRTTDYISYDQIGAFRSIAPGIAALRLSDIKVPHVASVPPKPVFV